MLPAGSLLAVFSGTEVIKTNDEYYPFFADRNFVYLTGLTCKEAVLLASKDADGSVKRRGRLEGGRETATGEGPGRTQKKRLS